MARRMRRSSGPLDLRSQAILRAVIEEYVTTAAPVGSVALVERYRFGVSSATVRSVLAELEAAGLLTHPHTSAGRGPTEHGHRYYVESIVDSGPLPPVEQLIIPHQFGEGGVASEHWFPLAPNKPAALTRSARLAAPPLAPVPRSAGLATPAKPSAAHLRRLDLVRISDRLASLILVLREGALRQLLVNLDRPTDQDELSAVANRLNELLAGRTSTDAARVLARFDAADPGMQLPRRVGDRVVRALQEFDGAAIEELFSDGLLNVMAAPEFAQSEKLRRVFSALENRAYLADLIAGVSGGGGVRIWIGSENPAEEMADVSLVLAPYGNPKRAVGVVGVLGPTRMAYPQAIGTVRFVSGLMNELIDHLYA